MSKKIIREVNIQADFSQTIGKFKPMHGIGQPPIYALSDHLMHYLKEAGIPYSRLHDVGGWMGGGLYVDIPNLFRDFDADENDPASYDFAFTDKIMEYLMAVDCEPYFRLGVSIENQHRLKSYRIFPPKDYGKWARICEHVIAHYIDGWAEGYHFPISYWEIWNEPDDCFLERTSAMWKGTPEQYYDLYITASKHLKQVFGDRIKIGGYGHCGLYEYVQDPDLKGIGKEPERIYEFVITFLHGFMQAIQKEHAPLDFFSWHVYDNCHKSTESDFRVIAQHADYIRRILDHYGYEKTEHHLNEWNLYTVQEDRDNSLAAAKTLGFMLMMQNTSTDVMCYYDGRIGYGSYGGIFNPDTVSPYRNYYAFMSYNSLYALENQCPASCDDGYVFVGAAAKGIKGALVIANPQNEPLIAHFDLKGMATDDVQILLIDCFHRYTLTGMDLKSGTLTLPPNSCMEVKLWNLN